MAFIMISLFGCFSKKKQPLTLSAWLETNFPGQLAIVHDVIDLDPKNLYAKKKATIVAMKDDPETQIKVTWTKNQDDLNITIEEIDTLLARSKRDMMAARKISSALKENEVSNISVGVIDKALYVLVFEEPTPEIRKKYLDNILTTINKLPDHEQTSIWIECMEPDTYRANFKDIIPYGYWHRGDNYHRDKTIMALDFEWSEGIEPERLMSNWSINTASERSTVYRQNAFEVASEWSTKNIPSPFYLEPAQMVMVEPDQDDPMAIRFYFPYFASKPDTEELGFEKNALGYVSGVYQVDQKTFSNITKVDEL